MLQKSDKIKVNRNQFSLRKLSIFTKLLVNFMYILPHNKV